VHGGVPGIGGIYVVSGDDSCKDGGFHIIRFFQISGKKPCYDTGYTWKYNHPPTDAVDKLDYVFK
jgi:hypothetical protein